MVKRRKASSITYGKNDFSLLLSKANNAISNGEIDKSSEIVNKAKRAAKGPHPMLSILVSKIKIKQGDLESSIKELEEALEKWPDNVELIVEMGQLHAKYGSGRKSFQLLAKAIDKDPDNYKVLVAFANACQRNKQLHEAIKNYRKCLFELSKKNISKNIDGNKRKEGFNKPETEVLLWNTLAQLAEAGVHAFPSHGTLLGIVREGGLLDHDKDLDIGIPFSEAEKAARVLKENGWIQHRNNFGLINPISFVHKENKVSLDLCGFVVEKTTGKTLYGFWMPSIPKNWNRILELSAVDLQRKESNGYSYWFPKKPADFLKSLYGNWETPDPDYDALIDSNGLRDFSLLTECYAYSSIVSALDKNDFEKAKKKFKVLLKHYPNDDLAQLWLQKLEKVA
ncbi:hypothetical protein ELY33_12265 [Vreelandella andesensis]|uniref:Uncharacterized protein n=1 Tax=Vreelandella andesensis TaxID=447567 RepID=A0A433KJ33_9GAMM|nr:LicD family protein [Halomonas andesensis]RUR29712.1 hypothetical protein ELY33_12265 [Halomonas andesensis]